MEIKDLDSGKLDVDVYDKRQDFPFPVIRYPHMVSLIPTYIPYGVFLGCFTVSIGFALMLGISLAALPSLRSHW